MYIDGCTAIAAAESLKYNNTSTTLLDECAKTINQSQYHLKTVYNKCAKESCENLKYIFSFIANGSDISVMENKLHDALPWFFGEYKQLCKHIWFFVSVVLFNPKKNPEETFYDGKINYVTVVHSNYVHRIVLWLPFANQYYNGPFQYGVEFNSDAYLNFSNGMNLVIAKGFDRSSVLGFHMSNNTLRNECHRRIDTSQLRIPTYTYPTLKSTVMTAYAITGIVIGSLFGLGLLIYCIVSCFRG